MRIGETITLNSVEQGVALFVAKSRQESARKNNLKDTRVGIRDPFTADLEGFAAEMAICKMFDAFPDFEVSLKKAKNDCGDLKIKGYSIDVKTSKNPNAVLSVKPWKKGRVHGFALMTGVFPTYTLKGLILSEDVFRRENFVNGGTFDSYCVPQDKLVDIETFLLYREFEDDILEVSRKEQAI